LGKERDDPFPRTGIKGIAHRDGHDTA
jgi:hypothetical protein